MTCLSVPNQLTRRYRSMARVDLPAVRHPIGAKTRCVQVFLLPLPACHKGVYARRSLSSGRPEAGPVGRAMETVGVRGHKGGLAECNPGSFRLAESPLARNLRKERANSDLPAKRGE